MPATLRNLVAPVGESTTAQHVDTADAPAERPSPLAPPLGQALGQDALRSVMTLACDREIADLPDARAYALKVGRNVIQDLIEFQRVHDQALVLATQPSRTLAEDGLYAELTDRYRQLTAAIAGSLLVRARGAVPLPG